MVTGQMPGRRDTLSPDTLRVLESALETDTRKSVQRNRGSACLERKNNGLLSRATGFGADTRGAGPEDAGEVLARRIVELMRKAGIPNGIGAVGFAEVDAERLAQSAIRLCRAIANAPREASSADVADIFRAAVSYW